MKALTAANGLVETYRPSSIVQWEAQTPAPGAQQGADRVIAIIGPAASGTPLQPYIFTNAQDARLVLQSGELLDAIQYAFNPGELGAPRAVIGVNITGGTQATYNVRDSAAAIVFTLKTKTYREAANQTQITISGSSSAPEGFYVELKDFVTQFSISSYRVGHAVWLTYTGAGTASTGEIVMISGVKYLRTLVTGAASDNILIPLNLGFTVDQLCRRINESGPYSATPARDGDLDSSKIDIQAPISIQQYPPLATLTALAILGATTLAVTALTRNVVAGEYLRLWNGFGFSVVRVNTAAVLGDVVLLIDALSDPVTSGAGVFDSVAQSATRFSAVKADFEQYFTTRGQGIVEYATGPSLLAPVAVTQAFFTGGGTLPTTTSDWGKATVVALDYPLASIIPLSDSEAINSGVRSAVYSANAPLKGKFVMAYTGIPSSLLPADNNPAGIIAYKQNLLSLASSINNRDALLVGFAVDAVSPATGLIGQIKPYMAAVMVAATRAGGGAGQGLTYKKISASNPFPKLTQDRDVNDLIAGGILVLAADRQNGPTRIERDRTTYLGVDSPILESGKQVAVMNKIAREVRDLQWQSIPGKAATPRTIAAWDATLERYLTRLEELEVITAGVDGTSGTRVDAFNFKVFPTTDSGQKVFTSLYVNPTGELIVGDTNIVGRPVEIQVVT